MSLHPTATHWFEAYVPRDQTVYALEALAATGQVELDKEIVGTPLPDTAGLRAVIRTSEQVTTRYADLLPPPQTYQLIVTNHPEHTARRSLETIRDWIAGQLRLLRRRRDRRRELDNLTLLSEGLNAMGEAREALPGFEQPSDFLYKRILACPLDDPAPVDTAEGFASIYFGPEHAFVVIVALPEQRADFDAAAGMHHCKAVKIPPWLAPDRAKWGERLKARINGLVESLAELDREIAANRADARLGEALNEVAVLRWFLDHTVTLTEDRRHCYVTGWTSVSEPQVLQRALRRAGVEAAILFRPGPANRPPPVRTTLPRWARPFRLFVNMMGTPDSVELDPTPLLTFLVPLLFGLMFPDVGHGALLAIGAQVLSRRYPSIRFLVPCGLSAAAFGLLFGETFGSHALLPALWFHPLEQPETILVGSLIIGAGIILLGLALSGIEARWRGELRRWLWQEGAVLVLYAGLLLGLIHPAGWVLAGLSLFFYLLGLPLTCDRRSWQCLTRGIGRLLISVLELGLNTLSFLRVGAFALAHAALSHTLLELAELIEHPALRIGLLVLGHAAILLVEGLVVFVQTTRLVLFEFFIRFLRAEGRLFRPMPAPDRLGRTAGDEDD